MAVTFVIGALQSVARSADEMVANPPYKHWSAFKVGTTVTQNEKVKFSKGSDEGEYYPGGVHEKDLTFKLLEVTPEKAVVQLTVTDYGVGHTTELAPAKITYPAKVKKSHANTSKEGIESFKEGEEDVKVQGKTVHAHWTEITDKEGDETFYHKSWTSDEIPGGIVKSIKWQKEGKNTVTESEESVSSYHKG
jgi:hypothetical protein